MQGDIDLLLKSLDDSTWESGFLSVKYDVGTRRVYAKTEDPAQGQIQWGGAIPASFADGDRFRAVARDNGMVEVYQNDTLLGIRDASGWPAIANGGFIGMSVVGLTVDDFGGGNLAQVQSSVKYNFHKVLAARMQITAQPQLSDADSLVLVEPLSMLQLGKTEPVTITYTYDGLDRLTAVDYTDGYYFHYTYEAVGNWLSETIRFGVNPYTEDDATRLATINGVAYTLDNNGNLLNDGKYT